MVAKIYIHDSAERWRIQRDQFTSRRSTRRRADEEFAHHLLTFHEMYCREPVCVENKSSTSATLPTKPALRLTPVVHTSSLSAPGSVGSSRERPKDRLVLQSDPSGCRTHQDAPISGCRGSQDVPQRSQDSASPDHAYCRNMAKETILKVVMKEIIEEPQPSEELGYQTCKVKEEVLDEDWTVDDGGQAILTEPKSIEQPETCLVKEEQLGDGWTEDSDGSQDILTEPKSTEQPETCLVKEEQLGDGWTEDSDGGQEILTEPKSIEQPETNLVKDQEEELSGGWTEDSGAKGVCQDAPSEESVHRAYHTDSLQEEGSRTEDDNAKEMETEFSDESDYEMYCVKEEPLDSDCTEDDSAADLQIKLQASLLSKTSNSENKNTKRQLKFSLQVFQEFCVAGDVDFDQLSDIDLETLDQLLGKFYAGVKSTTDRSYSKKSMQALRYGLQKHFLNWRDIDIVKDTKFVKSGRVFKTVLRKLREEGKDRVKHHKIVSETDMNKIQDSLDQDTPCGLQRKVFVDIMTHFLNRGVEKLHDMKADDFLLSEQNGRRYFRTVNKPTKINPDDLNSQGGRMFEIPGSNRCPVATLLKYKSKLNLNLPFLWQKPKKAAHDYGPWYDNVRMGMLPLGRMMKTISSEAGCSTSYTNHSLVYKCMFLCPGTCT